jgi:hypothetical protein
LENGTTGTVKIGCATNEGAGGLTPFNGLRGLDPCPLDVEDPWGFAPQSSPRLNSDVFEKDASVFSRPQLSIQPPWVGGSGSLSRSCLP